MRRQSFLVRVILIVFSVCSVSLPLDHTCLDNGSSVSSSEAPAITSPTSHDLRANHKIAAWESVHSIENGRDSVCPACLWSHSQLHIRLNEGLGVPQFVVSGAVLRKSPGIILASLFDATSKRGPPRSASA